MDDDPNASMVVMRRFLFYTDDLPQPTKPPVFKIEKSMANGDSVSSLNMENTLTTATNKSSRRVTLFEGK